MKAFSVTGLLFGLTASVYPQFGLSLIKQPTRTYSHFSPLITTSSYVARTETLNSFRDGQVQLLVCSDVAARGLDLPEVSHVFNFDVPVNPEDYIHRIGRTGRAGKSGRAFMLITSADYKALAAIERMTGKKIEEMSRFSVEMDPVPEKPLKKHRRHRNGKENKTENHPESVKEEQKEPVGKTRKENFSKKKGGHKKMSPEKNPAERHNKTEPAHAFGSNMPAFLLNTIKLL